MTDANWESQGASARSTDENAIDSPALRALTAIGFGLLAGAVLIFGLPLMVPHSTEIGDAPLRSLSTVEILVGTVVAATGVVVLAIRIATGAVLHAVASRAMTTR